MSTRYQVLWIEDAEFVKPQACKLTAFLHDRGVEADVDVDDRPGDGVLQAEKRAQQGHPYDVVICDLSFDSSGSPGRAALDGVDAIAGIRRTLPSTPVIIYSARLEEFEAGLGALRPRPIRIDKSKPFEHLYEQVADILSWQPPCILHLSDLHFGSMNGFRGMQHSISDFFFSATGEVDKFIIPRRPNLVLVTGDLGSTADYDDYHAKRDAAGVFLAQLLDALRLPRSSCVIVPGNHDVHLQGSNGQEWLWFSRFLREFYGDDSGLQYYASPDRIRDGVRLEQSDLQYTRAFDQMHALVVGLNSNRITDTHGERNEHGFVRRVDGHVASDQIDPLIRAADDAPPDYLRISLMHHPVFPVPSLDSDPSQDRVVGNWGLLLRSLAVEARMHLVLHGHSHYPSVQSYCPIVLPRLGLGTAVHPVHVIAGASLGARLKDRQPAYSHLYYQIVQTARGADTGANSKTWSMRIDARQLAMDTLRWATVPNFVPTASKMDWIDLDRVPREELETEG